MSMDKAIERGKEHRKQYYGWKAYDPSCRNHGSDPCFLSNRTHKNRRRSERLTAALAEYKREA